MYYVANVTDDQIRQGILFKMSDALDAVFTESAKVIMHEGKRGTPQEMAIYFDDPESNIGLHNTYFVNEAAKEVLDGAGVHLEYAKQTISELPEVAGTLFIIPRYINLH